MRLGGIAVRTLEGERRELHIEGGRFVESESGGPVLDLTSWIALAPLADCHAHLAATSIEGMLAATTADLELMHRNGRLHLDAGVHLLADKGWADDGSLRYKGSVPPDERPDLDMAGGMLVGRGGYYPGWATEVDGDDLAMFAARRAATEASWVKIVGDWPRKGRGAVPSFTEEQLRAAAGAAHAAGKRVAIHTLAPVTPGLAVAAGVDSIEHGLFMTDRDVSDLGARGGAWVPTIGAMEMLRDQLGSDSSGGRLLSEGLANLRDLLPGAAASGIQVLAGSDVALPHGGIAAEAVRLAAYGMAARDVVDAMSRSAYRYLGRPEPLRAGAEADVICVEGDPREDLSLLSRPVVVVRRGIVRRHPDH